MRILRHLQNAVTTFDVPLQSGRDELKGKYHCTVDLLFGQFRNVHLCSTKFSAPSTEAHFQTSQNGGQPYSDTSPSTKPHF